MATQIDDPRKVRLVEWMLAKVVGRQVPSTWQELADEIGVAPRTLRDWKDQDEVVARRRELAVEVGGEPERIRQVLDSLFEQAVDRDCSRSVAAAKVWAAMVGVAAAPEAEVSAAEKRASLMGLTDDELDRLTAEVLANR